MIRHVRSRLASIVWIGIPLIVETVQATSTASGQTLIYESHGAAASDQHGQTVSNYGDLDGDGLEEFAVGAPLVNVGSSADRGRVVVYRGSDGSVLFTWFGLVTNERFGSSIDSAGDLNMDGVPDLLIGAPHIAGGGPTSIGHVRAFSGATGSLLFDISKPTYVGHAFGACVANVGDVDNDSVPDVAIGRFNGGTGLPQTTEVYSGANQTLLRSVVATTPGNAYPRSCAGLGDLDTDGFDDFLVGEVPVPAALGRVRVISGHTGSTLQLLLGASIGDGFGQVVANAGDLTGDGKSDAFAGSPVAAPSGTPTGRVQLFSAADGTLVRAWNGSQPNEAFGNSISSVGDLDLDGVPDAIFGAPQQVTQAGRVEVVHGSDGSVWFEIAGLTGDKFGDAVAAADVTGDGLRDLIVGSPANDVPTTNAGAAYVYDAPSRNCSTSLPHYDVGSTPRDVLLVDRDGDGDRDAVTANSGAGTLTVLTNDGLGGFGAAALTIALGAGDDPQSVVTQGTGLAVACPSTNAIRLLAPSAGSWTYSRTTLTPPGQRPVDLASGNLDGAGGVDLAIALEGSVFGVGGGVAVSLGGAPVMLPSPPGGFLSIKRVAIGDLDGDGDQDIVAGMSGTAFAPVPTANILLYENTGSGSFTYVGALPGGGVPSGLALHNIDNDNDVDLIVIAQPVPPFGTTSGLTVFTNNGTGAFGPSRFMALSQLAAGSLPGDVVALDLNSDSLPGFISLEDVVVADTTGSTLKSFRSFGTTSFASTEDLEADDTPVALAAGDLNADGIPDLVEVNAGCDSLTVSLSTLNALAQKFGTGCAGTAGKVPAISAEGLPTFGNPSFGVKLTNGRAASFVFFGISLNYLNAPLGGGCTLFLTPPVAFYSTFTDATGQTQIGLPIPNAVPPFVGLNAYFQYFVNDPVGGYSGFAFSDALRIRLGN